MAFLGMFFSFGSIMAFVYWGFPWWLIVAIAALLLFGGGYLIDKEIWDDVAPFCGVALAMSGLFFVTGFFYPAEGGWSPFSEPNWIILLYSLVYWTLMGSKKEKDARDDRYREFLKGRRD